MPGLLSPAGHAGFRAGLALFLVHRYSRTQMTAGAEDAWGDTPSAPGATVSGLPCAYAVKDVLEVTEAGRTTVSTPTLTVPSADPLVVGDRVSNILDSAGGVLLAGPLTVESVDPNADFGESLEKKCVLKGVDTRRSG